MVVNTSVFTAFFSTGYISCPANMVLSRENSIIKKTNIGGHAPLWTIYITRGGF